MLATSELWPAMPEELQAIDADLNARLGEMAVVQAGQLAPEQCDVVKYIAELRSAEEIALLLNMSPSDATSHKKTTMQVAGMGTPHGLVSSGYHSGWLPIERFQDKRPHVSTLSLRQSLVLKSVVLGDSQPMIKRNLNLSPRSVSGQIDLLIFNLYVPEGGMIGVVTAAYKFGLFKPFEEGVETP